MGNLRSVAKACEAISEPVEVSESIGRCDRLILPGVGAFAVAMQRLRPVIPDLKAWVRDGRPILGICLGQQLFFESSEEYGGAAGLGLIEGDVRYLPGDRGLKVPHIGWSLAAPCGDSGFLDAAERYYFVHSLACHCTDPGDVAATSVYGVEFAAAVRRGTLWGTQFHPEKSGRAGLELLRRFLTCS